MAQLPSGESQIVPQSENDTPDVVRRDISAPQGSAPRRAEIRAAHVAGTRWRLASRWMGLIIFLLGAGLLAFVFVQALHGFQEFGQAGNLNSQFNSVAGDDWQARLQAVAAVLGAQVLRVAYLLILGFLASAIAARGIQFFAASEAIIDEAVVPEE